MVSPVATAVCRVLGGKRIYGHTVVCWFSLCVFLCPVGLFLGSWGLCRWSCQGTLVPCHHIHV